MDKKVHIDLIGRQFGQWAVLGYERYRKSDWQHMWLCRCQCGTEKAVTQYNLLKGISKSCGCRAAKHATHGFAGKGSRRGSNRRPEYSVWAAMLQRCNNPRNPAYSYYGGRGVSVCERWSRFENFISDMGCRPDSKSTLDRKDNQGDYTPDNCRWVPMAEQLRNTRRTRMLTLDGETKCLKDWAKQFGVNQQMISHRIKKGWSLECAVKKPPQATTRMITLDGKTQSLTAWAKERGIHKETVRSRLNLGWPVEEALGSAPRGALDSP